MFLEKSESRFKVRTKLSDILFSYLSKIKLLLPFPAEKQLHLNLMKVLGFCFFIYLFLFLYYNFNYFYILIYLIDSVNDYDLRRNTEIVKLEGNVVNGIVGMKRDANLLLIEFFHTYGDIREVFTG
jgi:hypothetical protein